MSFGGGGCLHLPRLRQQFPKNSRLLPSCHRDLTLELNLIGNIHKCRYAV
jgi:hypothetical protein